ncbi:hypothetical protein ACJJTC_017047 [Scirpophaga incertulas]
MGRMGSPRAIGVGDVRGNAKMPPCDWRRLAHGVRYKITCHHTTRHLPDVISLRARIRLRQTRLAGFTLMRFRPSLLGGIMMSRIMLVFVYASISFQSGLKGGTLYDYHYLSTFRISQVGARNKRQPEKLDLCGILPSAVRQARDKTRERLMNKSIQVAVGDLQRCVKLQ